MPARKEPTELQWNRLFEAAERFKQAECWEWMYDSDIFAVQDPESGELLYCSIMGNAGQHYGLVGYIGPQGLHGLLEILHETVGDEDLDSLFVTNSVMCSWEDRDQLEERDRDLIKSHGLKFRGRNAWPLFRRHKPGLVPWYITAEECQLLVHVLEQSLEVAHSYRGQKNRLGHWATDPIPLRASQKQGDGSIICTDEAMEIEPPTLSYTTIAFQEVDPALVAAPVAPGLVLEVDCHYLPMTVGDREPPYFPILCTLIEAENGMVVSLISVSDLETEGDKGVDLLTRFISEQNVRPEKLVIARIETYYLFVEIAKALKIPIERVEKLEHTPVFRAGLIEGY